MSKIVLFVSVLFFAANSFLSAALPGEIWEVFENNNLKKARELLEEALKNEETKVDAALTLILLNNLEDTEKNPELLQSIYNDMVDPSPYLFVFWFDRAVTSGYGKKDVETLIFLKEIMNDERVHPSLKAALHYVFGMHYVDENNVEKARESWNAVSCLRQWQYTGYFDNASGSGFNKDYAPIDHPEADASFVSARNSHIYWFSPSFPQKDIWMSTEYHIHTTEGIIYAQCFVESPENQELVLAVGCTGNIKVWINDAIVIEKEEERRTELDIYKSSCFLNKGFNRVLVQLGYTSDNDFPNFIIRFLNEDFTDVQNLKSVAAYKPYEKASSRNKAKEILHFAETYFKQKITQEPDNVLNHILLSMFYYRNQMHNEAIMVLRDIETKYPNNVLVQYQILRNYLKLKNRTQILQQVEKIRLIQKDILFILEYDLELSFEAEKYADAQRILNDLEARLGKNNETFLAYKMKLLLALENYLGLIELIEKSYHLYPENTKFLTLYFQIKKESEKTKKSPVKILEAYLENNYSYKITELLAKEYIEMGKPKKAEKIYLSNNSMFPESTAMYHDLISFYYSSAAYEKSLDIMNKALENTPFSSSHYNDRSYIHQALKMENKAMEDLEKAIHYNPNLFEARERLRRLQNRKEILSYFRRDDIQEIINAGFSNTEDSDENFVYLLDEHNYAIFPEGAFMQYNILCIKILNKSGVESWEDASVSYNDYSERLIIEEADIYKPGGKKFAAEKYNNHMVFPGLEAGDIILIKYRIDHYTGGRLSKEFWYTHVFNSVIQMKNSTLRILTKPDYHLNFLEVNMSEKPVKTQVDEFTLYEWSFQDVGKIESEPYMPSVYETGKTLHISTLSSWKIIADWYSDVVIPLAKSDYTVDRIFNEIFPDKSYHNKSDMEKAKRIYNYICDHINYSSIPFRQSNYVPQKPSETITTQLGDCKDMATLYHTLAKMAGLTTNIVLVSTRDNGQERIKLPSLEFNHAVVRIMLNGKPFFLELTSNKQPFGAIPDKLIQAQALVIPNNNKDTSGQNLINIPDEPLFPNSIEREISYFIKNDSVRISTTFTTVGNSSASLRDYFSGLTQKETNDHINALYSGSFENNYEVTDYVLDNIDTNKAVFTIQTDISIDNEIKTIGGLKVFKPIFFEKIATSNEFQEKNRKYPVLYWDYENFDQYETEVTINLPENTVIEELPQSNEIKSFFLTYKTEINEVKSNQLIISRTVQIDRRIILPSQYAEFLNTLNEIIKAEDIYIAYRTKDSQK